jgi:DNA-binding NarL/FixJ family response regulator
MVAELLRDKCGVAVVGSALDGAEAIDVVLRLQPDILILEIIIPVIDGIMVTRKLRKLNSATKIIVLTSVVDTLFQSAAIAAGAQAYVIKARIFPDLPDAIAAVTRGEQFVSKLRI